MDSLIFVVILVIILVIIKLFFGIENFTDCSKFNDDYNKCYNNGCTVMIDVAGNSFCTNK